MGLGAGDGVQLRRLRLDCAWRPRAVLGDGGQPDRARLHRACDWADDRLVAGRPGRAPPPRSRLHRLCRRALWGVNALLQISVAGYRVGDVADTINAGVLACIVAAIAHAMMRVDA